MTKNGDGRRGGGRGGHDDDGQAVQATCQAPEEKGEEVDIVLNNAPFTLLWREVLTMEVISYLTHRR